MNDQQTLSRDTPTRIEVQTEQTTTPPTPEDRIRIRAYELYERRNREEGHAEEDWFQAEAEITGRTSEAEH